MPNDSGEAYEPLMQREREKPDRLTKQQINQVLMTVEDMHPLADKAKSYHIVPQFKWCLHKIKKPNFAHALRQTLMQDMGLHLSRHEDELIENPFLMLGFGINAYFDMMLQLCEMFFIITLFFIPVFAWYHNNEENALATTSLNPLKQLKTFTLGNLGGASTVCAQKKIKSGSMSIECPAGLFMDYNNIIFGVMSSDVSVSYYCQEKAIFQSGDAAPKCTRHMDHKFVSDQLKACDKLRSINPDLQQGCKINFQTDQKPKGLFKNGPNDPPVPESCWDDGSKFYIQTPCIIRERQLPPPAKGEQREFPNVYKRQIFGLMVVCLGVWVYLFTVIYMDYIKQIQFNKNIDFDVKTITAGDYTVEFDINKKVYEHWKEIYHKPDNPMSEMAQFKIYIQHKMEERMSKMEDLGYDGPWEGPGEKKIRIAQITFAFHNQDVINMLKKRGALIRTEKWDKVDQINDKIDDSLKNEKLLNELQHPCSVFLTFESEEGHNRAVLYNQAVKDRKLPKHYGKILGQPFHIEPASEPSDIIWENRQYTKCTRRWKRVVSYFIILCLLAVSATCIYLCSATSTSLKTKYPKTTCIADAKEYNVAYKQINQTWLDANPGPSSRKTLEREAFREYATQRKIEEQLANGDLSKRPFYTSALKCFCIFEKADETPDNLASEKEYVNPDAPGDKRVSICKAYFADAQNTQLLSISITLIIVIFNQILKRSTIALLTWVGEDTYSQRLASITTAVFVAQFFNTGILLLLVNANLQEHLPSYIAFFFQGKYYDYSEQWYGEVGSKIVQTMFINAVIIPWTGLIAAKVVPGIKRRMDGKSPYKTKKTSMGALKALWSGGDYVIHFKYSGMLNIAYITMMYGMGMPALFPLAVINYWNQYVAERLIVAYHMKAPAALDDKLTVNCINKLRFAPMLFLLNGAWMVGNQQIFQNVWSFIPDASYTMKSDHPIDFRVNWSTPAMMFGVLAVVLYILQVVLGHKLQEWGFQLADHDIQVDEDLPHFFEAVKLSQANELVLENHNMHQNFGFEPNDPDTIQILDNTKLPKKAIQGTPWYQILSNFHYAQEFNYVGAFVKEREKLIEDGFPEVYVDGKKRKGMTIACKHERWAQSDMVMILLNVAYIPDEVARKIHFKPGWQVQFKKDMEEYKQNFYKKHSRVWEYQNKRLEQDYIDYIVVKEKEDPDVLQEQTNDKFERKFTDYFVNLKNKKSEKATTAIN